MHQYGARPPVPRSTNSSIGILLVDDHHVVLDALGTALDRVEGLQIVGSAGCVSDIRGCATAPPDVAVVDYHLPDGTGPDACREIKARWPDARILMLSAASSDEEVLASVRAGADGFLTKSQRLPVLVDAIRAVHRRGPIVAPEMLGRIARGLAGPPEAGVLSEPLTPRELGVLRLLGGGASTREIARRLGIAEGTARRHVEAIRRKFGVRTRLAAVAKATRSHIIEVPTA